MYVNIVQNQVDLDADLASWGKPVSIPYDNYSWWNRSRYREVISYCNPRARALKIHAWRPQSHAGTVVVAPFRTLLSKSSNQAQLLKV